MTGDDPRIERKVFWTVGCFSSEALSMMRFYTRSSAEEYLRTNRNRYPSWYEVLEVSVGRIRDVR